MGCLTPSILLDSVLGTFKVSLPEKQKELGENIKKLALVNATKQIVDEVEKLLNK